MAKDIADDDGLDPILEQKRRTAAALLTGAAPGAWGGAQRSLSRARWLDMGAPHRRDEYWRFTGPGRFATAAEPAPADASSDGAYAAVAAATFAFVDGVFRPELSDAAAQDGVEIAPLSNGGDASMFGALESRGQEPVSRPLAALNGAAASDGLVIRATGAGARAIRIVARGGGDLRHLIKVEPGAELTLIEERIGAGRTSAVIEASVEDGGRFDHLRDQADDDGAEDIAMLFAALGAGASLKSFTLSAAAAARRQTRNESVVWLDGADGSADLAGAVAAGAGNLVDNTVFLTHGAPNCESRQVYKTVLSGDARGVFQGKILVDQIAQKTDGYQISQSVLLDDRASFQAKPELEIYADDVKCSHGSTTGAIDATALFYLRSRGVPDAVAKTLLIQAFLEDAIVEIADPALQVIARETAARSVGGLAG